MVHIGQCKQEKTIVNLTLTNILYNLAEIGHPGSPFAAIVIFKKP